MKIWEDDNQKYIKAMMEKNTTEQNEKLTKRLEEIDFSVLEHIERKETVNERGVFAPLDAVEVSEIEARGAEFKELGLKVIREGKVGAVLLAGGQGTRLGLDRPKGTLNIGVAKELYLFEQLLRNLMDVTDEAGVYVPLYIMTSNINNADTTAFFEEHDYFGYPKDYVKFFVQEMVPACDYEGRIYMESQTEVAMSPNGNGGWFSSMVNAGLLSDIKERGIEWINVFAVDNCLQRIADPMFVGATIAYGCESGAKVVRKAAPDERVGVLCTEDGKPSIAEYYEMTEEMATARKENGDLKYGFGVILNYLFSEKKLEQIADARMPIHVVEKKIPYMDVDGTFVKPEQPNGYKFETLVLDMVHMMDDCIPYEVVREREFAPIKNLHGVDSLDSARGVGEGPFTCEFFGKEADELRNAGFEFGAKTGRPRRVGPIDIVATRYGIRCQGATSIALTKLDVLSYMDRVPVCAHYELDGKQIEEFPFPAVLADAKPVMEYLPGWKCDISGCRTWDELPENAKKYVEYVEKNIGCHIGYVSVGPERDSIIYR